MDRINIAVAGLGRVGWSFHAKGLSKHPDFKLLAVSDLESDRRDQAQNELGCKVVERFGDLIAQPGLEAVVIATPTHLHREMALQAFERGLHVLLEKPMAMNLDEAREIAEAAVGANRKLTVYQPHRLGAYYQHLRRIMMSGRIGRLYWIRCGMFGYSRRNDWQSLIKYGGGMLNNYGAHGVDQIMGMIGFEVKRVFCDLMRVATLGDADDVVKIVLETSDGVLGEVDISMASALNPYRLMAWGTRGAVFFKGGMTSGSIELRTFDPACLPDKVLNERLASANRQYPFDNVPFEEETIPVDASLGIDVFADFAASIRTGRPPVVPPEETLAVMETLERCRQDSGDVEDFRESMSRPAP